MKLFDDDPPARPHGESELRIRLPSTGPVCVRLYFRTLH
jgi:hypothetical protein